MARTYLIVNGDDFGMSPGANVGIARAHREGILTSTSMMVRWPSARDAALEARTMPGLAVGLHLDLGEKTYENEEWRPLYHVVDTADAAAVAAELERQIEAFHDLLGTDPTHLDSHQHVHRQQPTRGLVAAMGRRLGLPVRHLSPSISYVGDFYGQSVDGAPCHDAISVAGLIGLIGRLPAGTVELACHPSAAPDMEGMYRHERMAELSTLCDPAVRRALAAADVELRSFRDLAH